jgi:RND family efflux transporter MFP subunit
MQKNLKNKLIGNLQLVLVISFVIATITFSQILKSKSPSNIKINKEVRKIPVEQIQIKQKNHFLNFKINGFVVTGAKIQLIPQVSGRISHVSKKSLPNSTFNKNHILFEIYPLDFELNITKITSEIKKNEVNLRIKTAEHEVAISEWKRVNGKKPIPDLVSKKPQLEVARAVLMASQANLQIAKIQLERTRFSLPFDGRILSSNIALGQFIQSGQSLGEAFDIKSIEIESSLNKEELRWLKSMKKPKILIHTQDQKTHEVEISRISGILNPKTRFTNIAFSVSDEIKKLLKPGQFVEIKITDTQPIKVLNIPIEALQEGDSVWEIADMKLKGRKINILQITKDHAVSLSNKKEVNIAIGNLLGSSDGDLVKILNKK